MKLKIKRAILTALLSLSTALPLAALAQSTIDQAPTGKSVASEPVFFVLNADAVAHPQGNVVLRFEIRNSHRVVGTHEVLMDSQSSGSVLVPLPDSPTVQWFRSGAKDAHLLVYANGLLLHDFSMQELARYSRQIRYRLDDLKGALTNDSETTGGGTASKTQAPAPIRCDSPCGGGCGPYDDVDCDGVNNSTDNCLGTPNPGQENCDSDWQGDVCDHLDATYQPSGPVNTCMTDKDGHGAYYSYEHHVEQLLVDVSSCNAPNTWDHWIRAETYCTYGFPEGDCCHNGIGGSIASIGDNPFYWCEPWPKGRNRNFCH